MFQITTHDFPFIKRDIKVRIAIPKNVQGKIPFIIMHDAQNIFDAWEEPETKTKALVILSDLIERKMIQPIALIGIDTWKATPNLERFTEFSPWISGDIFSYMPSFNPEVKEIGGRGDQYADFVVRELVPFLEQNYNIGGDSTMRAMAGSSMGAMITLYISTKYSNTFSKLGLLSPALWCFKKEYSSYLQNLKDLGSIDRIYMDIGRKESSDPQNKEFPQTYLDGAFFIYDILRTKCPNIQFNIDEQGEHDMPSIARHLPDMFRYLWRDY